MRPQKRPSAAAMHMKAASQRGTPGDAIERARTRGTGDNSPEPRKCCDTCPGDDTCEHARVCMCGDFANHSPWNGHSPVSMHDYYCEETTNQQNTWNGDGTP